MELQLQLEQPTSNSQSPYLKRTIRLARKATLSESMNQWINERINLFPFGFSEKAQSHANAPAFFFLVLPTLSLPTNQPKLPLINNNNNNNPFLLFFLSREQFPSNGCPSLSGLRTSAFPPCHPFRAFASALVSPKPLAIAAVKMIGSLRHGENTCHVFLQPKIMWVGTLRVFC